MNCPGCKKTDFEIAELEPDLLVDVCKNCHGKWIAHINYERWLEHHGDALPEIPGESDPAMTIPEFELAKLCPGCRRILIKYKVGRNLPFKIDRCSNCAGVWLEENEWEILKSRNLHDELNKIFTDHWQEEVDREHTRNVLKTMYREKFGVDDFEKICEFKEWVDKHEKRNEISAYIRDKNPLQF